MKTIKAAQIKKQAVEVKEMFILVGTRPLDSKHRITVGGKLQKLIAGKMNIDSYQVFIGKKGDILLRPAVSIPIGEAWAYRNPEVIGKIRRGLLDAAEGRVERVNDLENFLKDL